MTVSDAEPGGPAAGRPSRAGRNLPAAIAVGAALVAIILVSLFVVEEAFIAVVVAAGLLAIWELHQALLLRDVHLALVPLVCGALVLLGGGYWGGVELVAVAYALTAVACLVWRLPGGHDGYVADVTASLFVTTYVPLLGGFVVLLLAGEDGPWRIVAFIVTTIASDIGGYAVGVLFGRHPMAPRISPKKTWEGFAGSVAGCLVAGWLSVRYALDGPVWVGLLLGAAVVVVASLGDLVESQVKRDLGIKDMGTLLPGHGGIMDRLDSLLPVAPVAWLIFEQLL